MLFANSIQAVLRQMDQLLQPICQYIKQDTIFIHMSNTAFFYNIFLTPYYVYVRVYKFKILLRKKLRAD